MSMSICMSMCMSMSMCISMCISMSVCMNVSTVSALIFEGLYFHEFRGIVVNS